MKHEEKMNQSPCPYFLHGWCWTKSNENCGEIARNAAEEPLWGRLQFSLDGRSLPWRRRAHQQRLYLVFLRFGCVALFIDGLRCSFHACSYRCDHRQFLDEFQTHGSPENTTRISRLNGPGR